MADGPSRTHTAQAHAKASVNSGGGSRAVLRRAPIDSNWVVSIGGVLGLGAEIYSPEPVSG